MSRIPVLAGPRVLLPLLAAALPVATVTDAVADAIADGPGYAAPGLAPVASADEPRVCGDAAGGCGDVVGIDRRVREDAVADRSYFTPTALVAPAGTSTLTIQAPLLPGGIVRVDRSFSDRLSLGVGVLGFVDDEDLYGIGNLHAKYQLARGRRAALAVTASIYNFPGELELDSGGHNLFVAGVAASLCTDDACRTLITIDAEAMANVSDETLPIIGGVAIASGGRRQLLAEVHTTTADDDRLWFGFVGGRFLGRRMALDAGLGFGAVRSATEVTDCIDVCTSDHSADIGLYPFLALSTRL